MGGYAFAFFLVSVSHFFYFVIYFSKFSYLMDFSPLGLFSVYAGICFLRLFLQLFVIRYSTLKMASALFNLSIRYSICSLVKFSCLHFHPHFFISGMSDHITFQNSVVSGRIILIIFYGFQLIFNSLYHIFNILIIAFNYAK